MKKIFSIIVLFVIALTSLTAVAQSVDNEMTELPVGTVLTLKKDFIIPAYEGIIAVEHDNKNYKVYNLVFDSKGKRRILRKGTKFEVESIEVAAGKLYIHIVSKLNWIYFGEVESRTELKIKELEGLFDIEFPMIEEF